MRPSSWKTLQTRSAFSDCHIQESAFTGYLVMGGRGLVHMPHAVLFVDPLHVGPELVDLPCRKGIEGEQVAVFPLRGGHDSYQFVQVQTHQRVGIDLQRVGGAFHDLVDIRVVKMRAFVPALKQARGFLEIADAIGLFALLEGVGNGHRAIGFQSRRPECVIHMYVIERHRLDVIVLVQVHRFCSHRALDRDEQGDKYDAGNRCHESVLHGVLLTSAVRWAG